MKIILFVCAICISLSFHWGIRRLKQSIKYNEWQTEYLIKRKIKTVSCNPYCWNLSEEVKCSFYYEIDSLGRITKHAENWENGRSFSYSYKYSKSNGKSVCYRTDSNDSTISCGVPAINEYCNFYIQKGKNKKRSLRTLKVDENGLLLSEKTVNSTKNFTHTINFQYTFYK